MTRSVPFDCLIASVWTANRFYRRVSPFMFRSFTFLASAFSLSSSFISIKAIGLQRMPFSSHSIRFRRCVQLDHPVSIEKMSIVAESILRADSEAAFQFPNAQLPGLSMVPQRSQIIWSRASCAFNWSERVLEHSVTRTCLWSAYGAIYFALSRCHQHSCE